MNSFIPYYEAQMAYFINYFEKCKGSLEVEHIHQLRVSVKRLRATWALAEYVSEGKWFKVKHNQHLYKLYKAAGIVRELQLNYALIKALDTKGNNYTKHTLIQIKKASKKLNKQLQSFDLDQFSKLNKPLVKILGSYSNTSIVKRAAQFELEKFQKITILRSELPDAAKLHKIRVHLKTMYHIMLLMSQIDTSLMLKKTITNIKLINQEIGIWHDYTVVLTSLKEFYSTTEKPASLKVVKGMIKEFKPAQKLRRKQISSLLDDHLSLKKLRLFHEVK